MTTLLFARHGQASFGQRNYDQLSELGAKQAACLGSQYAKAQRKIDAIVTGSLSRQQDSATHFLSAYQAGYPDAAQLQPTLIEGFNEFNHTDVFVKYNPEFSTEVGLLTAIASAPVPKVRLAELFNEAMLRWHSGDHDEEYLESWPQFNQRVQQALQHVVELTQHKQANTALIFTSGGVIAAITAHLLGQSSATAYSINRSLINTGVTSVVVKSTPSDTSPKLRLLSLNEHSHLYQQGQDLLTWH